MKSELHSKLQGKAKNYMLSKTYWICVQEMPSPMGYIDAWGMSRANNFNTMAIEVKISRSDFKTYSQRVRNIHPETIANECYILCPKGLIQPEEVDEKWGLLWYESHPIQFEGHDVKETRLVNKKKAPFIEMSDRAKLEILIHFLTNGANAVVPNKVVEMRKSISKLGICANPDYYCEFCGGIIKNWEQDFRFCSEECKFNRLT